MAKKKLEKNSKGGPKDNFWKISTKIEGTLIYKNNTLILISYII
jgi:hypothetical protein